MSADIPMKIMFENYPSVHLTVYRGKILKWLQSLKQIFINVSYHILVASLS